MVHKGGEDSADAPPSSTPAGCAARVGSDGLRRSALKRTVDAGLGRWLQTVSVDPLLARGHFRGWIIRSFNSDDTCYAGVDLRAGDVVTRVNGRGVEHPEEALEVWTKLPTSSELVIDFLRDGQARKVRFGIVDP
jgi:S1-C subfamily serine protease